MNNTNTNTANTVNTLTAKAVQVNGCPTDNTQLKPLLMQAHEMGKQVYFVDLKMLICPSGRKASGSRAFTIFDCEYDLWVGKEGASYTLSETESKLRQRSRTTVLGNPVFRRVANWIESPLCVAEKGKNTCTTELDFTVGEINTLRGETLLKVVAELRRFASANSCFMPRKGHHGEDEVQFCTSAKRTPEGVRLTLTVGCATDSVQAGDHATAEAWKAALLGGGFTL